MIDMERNWGKDIGQVIRAMGDWIYENGVNIFVIGILTIGVLFSFYERKDE